MLSVAIMSFELSLVYLAFLFIDSQVWLRLANEVGPIFFMAICLWGSYRVIDGSPVALLTPMPWFFAACGTIFGFGPLVYFFGSDASAAYCDAFYEIDQFVLLKTNLLNALGMAVVVTGFCLGRAGWSRKRSFCDRGVRLNEMMVLVWLFLVVGLAIKFLFAIPYYMGWISWTLPGAVQYLATLPKVAIILLLVMSANNTRRYMWLLFFLIGEELITALMSLSKMAVIEVIIAISLGRYLTRSPSFRSLATTALVLAALYVFVLSPFVGYARVFAGSLGVGSVSEIAGAISSFVAIDASKQFVERTPGIQSWWTRLNYANVQAFAIDDYDNGKGGVTLELIPYIFIPRLVYPDKPVMTPGRDFTAAISGMESDTATAPGLFAEAYWNGGWPVVVLMCLFVGLVFAKFSIFARQSIAAKRFEYLPIIIIGITLGYSITGWTVAAYFGPLLLCIAIYLTLRYLVVPIIAVAKHTR